MALINISYLSDLCWNGQCPVMWLNQFTCSSYKRALNCNCFCKKGLTSVSIGYVLYVQCVLTSGKSVYV